MRPLAKNRLFHIAPAFFLVMSALSLMPQDAEAYIKCDNSILCSETAMREGNLTRNRIQVAENVIVRQLQVSTNQILKAMGVASNATSNAATGAADMASTNAAEMQKREDKKDREREASVSCSHVAASQGPRGGGSGGSSKASGTGGSSQPGNVHQRWATALQESGQTSTPVPPPDDPEKHAADVAVGGCLTFASDQSWRGLMCSLSRVLQGASLSPFKDADIKAATLFDGPQANGSKVKNWSIPAERSPERDARSAYIKMINQASPMPAPTEEQMTDPRVNSYMGLFAEYEAARSLAEYPSIEFDRLTTIDPSTKSALDELKQSDAAFLAHYMKDLPPSAMKNGAVSPLLLLDILIESRLGNLDWHKRMSADETEREVETLMMQAQSLRMQRDLLVAQHQTNVLLGKALNTQLDDRYRVQLEQLVQDLNVSSTMSSGTQPAARP